MLVGDPPSTRAPDDAQALIREARRRQRRRWALIAAVLLALGVTVAVVGGGGGGQNDRARPARPDRSAPAQQPTALPVPVPGQLNRPHSLAVEPDGSLLIVNEGTSQILRRRIDGKLEVVAGTGTPGYSGDGGPATEAQIGTYAYGIAVAGDGTIYLADTSNNAIRAITPDGTITTIVGSDQVSNPRGVALAHDGVLYIADNGGLRRRAPDGTVLTVVAGGLGAITLLEGPSSFIPTAVAVDGAGMIYAANFASKQLIAFSPDGVIQHVWDSYVSPGGLVGTSDGVLIASYGGFSIDRVRNGELSTDIGLSHAIPGAVGFRPVGVAVSEDGTLYAADGGQAAGSPAGMIARVDAGLSVPVLETH